MMDDTPWAQEPPNGPLVPTYHDGPQPFSGFLTVDPGHLHQWEVGDPISPPGVGADSTTLPSRSVVRIWANPGTDRDRCIVTSPTCPRGNWATNTVRVTSWKDNGAGGQFGKLDAGGNFVAAGSVADITHYRCPRNRGPGNKIVTLEAKTDDDPYIVENSVRIPTYDDPAVPGSVTLTVTGSPDPDGRTRRTIPTSKTCACRCKTPIRSDLEPRTGIVGFEVPVTAWRCRGLDLGLTLSYESRSYVDPSVPPWSLHPGYFAAEFSGLSDYHARWTHTWDQAIEVVNDEVGEGHAVWYTGDGGVVDFDEQPDGTWASSHDGFFTLASNGPISTISVDPNTDDAFGAAVPWSRFTVTGRDGSHYVFDKIFWEVGALTAIPYFRLTSVTDSLGRGVTLTWRQNGRQLETVRDSNARGLDFTYNGVLLQSVQDPYGRVHTFGYTTASTPYGMTHPELASVTVKGPGTPSVTQTWTFTYAGDLLDSKREPSGLQVGYFYEPVNPARPNFDDWDGRMTLCRWADPGDASVREIRREGTTLVYPEGNRLHFAYDADGNETSVTDDWGRGVFRSFDGRRRPTALWTNLEGGGDPLLRITPEYAADGKTLVRQTTVDRLGAQTETLFNSLELPTRHTAFAVPGGQPYNQVTQMAWGGTVPISVTAGYGTSLALSTTFGYQNAWDSPSSVTDAVGRVTSLGYSTGTGAPYRIQSPANDTAPLGSRDRPPSVSTITWLEDYLPSLVVDPEAHPVSFSYRASPSNAAWLEVTTTQGSGAGARVSRVTLDAGGNAVEAVDPAGVVTKATYDGDGNPMSVTEAFGRTEARTTTFRYNRNGDLVQLTPPKGSTGTVRFDYGRYDENGNLLGGYEGQVTHISYPLGGEEYFGYDNACRLAWKSRKYRVGNTTQLLVTRYEYDTLHRLWKVTHPAMPNGPAGWTEQTTYDEFSRPVQVSDATGTTSYAWDVLDRITSVTPSGGRRALSLSYVADTYNKRWITRTTLAGTGTWEQQEDTKGRVSRVRTPFSQDFTLEYDLDGKLVRQVNANGTVSQYGYTSLDDLLVIQHFRNSPNGAGTGGLLEQFSYAYDPAGRVSNESALGSWHGFVYDGLGQLIQETGSDLGAGGILYGYDKNGNRSLVTRNGAKEWYGVDAADRLLWINTARNAAPTAGQTAPYSLYTYDDLGQTTSRDRRYAGGVRTILNFTWDADGRLRTAKPQGYSAAQARTFSATYDASGLRVSKQDVVAGQYTTATTESFGLHEGAITTRPGYTQSVQDTTHTPGFARRENGVDRFPHSDWLGSTRYETGTGGAATLMAGRYDAYGLTTARAGDRSRAGGWAEGWGYTREEGGAAFLDLDYLEQRYYDPIAGRFISRDPIGWAGGLNLYAYCEGDPLNGVDPSGLARDDALVQTVYDFLVNAHHDLQAEWRAFARDPGGSLRRIFRNTRHDEWRIYDPGIGDRIEWYTGINLTTGRRFAPGESRPMPLPMLMVVGGRGGGMLGGLLVRAQDAEIADELERLGWTVTHGGGRGKQLCIPDPNVPPTGRVARPRGSVFPDITAYKDDRVVHIQTVDVDRFGWPTLREMSNIIKILKRRPFDELIWIRKR